MNKDFKFDDKTTWTDGDLLLYGQLAMLAHNKAQNRMYDEQYRKAFSGEGKQATGAVAACKQAGARIKEKFSLRRNKA